MPPAAPRPRRRRLAALVLVVALLLGGALAIVVAKRHRPGDVSNPSVEFTVSEPPPPPKVESPRQQAVFRWPAYGYSKARTRYLPAQASVRPPFRQVWIYHGRSLLEFPPVIAGRSLYLLKNNGALIALSKRNGHVRWKRKLGELAAASPAVGEGKVFAVLLRRKNAGSGRVVALSTRTGHVLWGRPLPSRAESSPLLSGGSLYFGSENGTVYALRARDGAVRWTYRAGGAVKGGPALSDGIVYFGAYGGTVHAVRADDGHLVWRTRYASGNFYSTPAVEFGRVFLGSTDGRVYSFSARTGKLGWAKQTGGYVYGSPAVANIDRLGPTVFIGTYAGHFYALDARTGRPRWIYGHGGKLSGSATVVGDIVYFSNLSKRSTTALGVRTGRRVWRRGRGAFNPVVSDGELIFLTGYASLSALQPRPRGTPASALPLPGEPETPRADRRRGR